MASKSSFAMSPTSSENCLQKYDMHPNVHGFGSF
jgi:hypothetical protein